MIAYLSQKGRLAAAWIIFFVFYGEFAALALTHRRNLDIVRVSKPIAKDSLTFEAEFPAKKLVEKNLNKQDKSIHLSKNSAQSQIPADEPFVGGPSQPEMNTFKSIGADNMVNSFTGDFSYNIPLLDLGGYPINLFYNGGVKMDQDASWVGLGWNINPGTISRNMRGLPDDYNGSVADGDKITKIQNVKKDNTVGVSVGLNTEFAGHPIKIGGHAGIFYNNKRGISMEIGSDFSAQASLVKQTQTEKTAKDTFHIGATVGFNLNSQSGLSLSAGPDVSLKQVQKGIETGLSTSLNYNSRTGLNDLTITSEQSKYHYTGRSTLSFARSSFTPSIRMPFTRFNGNLKVKIGTEFIVVNSNGYIAGSYSSTYLAKDDKRQEKPAFGYMYYEKAGGNQNAMLDFNRLNDGTYTLKTPVISIPNYTYDIFSINGEGTGGSFRGYRGNMGFVRDNYTSSRQGTLSVTLDAGAGNIFKGGTELNGVYSKTEVGDWSVNNILRSVVKFDGSSDSYEGFYFKNPAEKSIIDESYYSAVGEDALVRPKLSGLALPLPIAAPAFEKFNADKQFSGDLALTSSNSKKNIRDKRTQIISFLTAEEADRIGLDKKIISFTENVFKPVSCTNSADYKTEIRRYNPGDLTYLRKGHHISEMDVLEGDGKRYVYGIPAYSIKQVEESFGTDQGNPNTQLATYDPSHVNELDKQAGRDGFFQREEMKGYAHSFLLTGILSPDYVDVTGDGISDDDIGSAVKFNYTRVNKTGSNSWVNQNWRSPMGLNSAHFNEGLKSDNGDDKALYTYGEKELWYTHSIETKNMIATFTLSDRHDGKSVTDETGALRSSYGQRKLERIDLYTKAEFLKANPRPVKTVHFKYNYSVCTKVPDNDHAPEYVNNVNINAAWGRLTLESIWFSYNGNETQVKNKYLFKYAANENGLNGNPFYSKLTADRWGNYKNPAFNPDGGTMPSSEFPYTLQNNTIQANPTEAQRNAWASVYCLQKVLLPSGAVLNVNYESDDYAYVQNKRAAQMTHIAGFGKNSSQIESQLYKYDFGLFTHPGDMDCNFVFFDVDQPITSNDDLYSKYLEDIKQLLMKIPVLMPTNGYGGGYEPITVYGTIKNYGYNTSNPNRFWIELNKSKTGGSQIMETVLQFVKDYLPSKVYRGIDIGEEPVLRQVVSAIQGMAQGFFQALEGFEANLKSTGKCRDVDLNRSFGRLANPLYKKFGGGHRVKSITISDNWQKLSDPSNPTGNKTSVYGQTYDYTKTEIINGISKIISSGVASYEPGIGNEENPFREILQYRDKQPLGPTDVSNIEMPVTEAFFPSPSVGYSKVTVRSIHNKDNKNLKSGTGTQITEYFTTKDFPVISDFTDFDSRSRRHYKPSAIERILLNQKKDFLTLSQGFRVVLNDMNGKIKSKTSYPENDQLNPINSTIYNYRLINSSGGTFRPDNNVNVIIGAEGNVQTKLIGKDIEIMNDFRNDYAVTQSAQLPLNADAFASPFPIILLNMLRATFKDESIYRSATTLKVINEYGILESMESSDKGSRIATKNIAYDAETGETLLSTVTNEFNKPVYNLNYPAHWVTSGMDLAYKNIGLTYNNVKFVNGIIVNSPQVDPTKFESGDEIYVVAGNGQPNNSAGCSPSVLPVSGEFKIWALDISKDDRNNSHSFIFIDREGKPYNAVNAYIRIIRSGKRNMIGTSVGSITSLANPIALVNGVQKIDITNATNVVNAGAAEYREKWRVQNGFYSINETVTLNSWAPVHNTTVKPDKGYQVNLFNYTCNNCSDFFIQTDNPRELMLRYYKHDEIRSNKGFLHFNLNFYQPSYTLLEARLSLFAHTHVARHDFEYMNPHINNGNPFYDGWHLNTYPHGSSPIANLNAIAVTKMLRDWPAVGSQSWANNNGIPNAYNDYPTDYYSIATANPPYSTTMDYSNYGNYGEQRINVGPLFLGLIQSRTNLGYTPGVKLSLLNGQYRNNQETRLCFTGRCNYNVGSARLTENNSSDVGTQTACPPNDDRSPFLAVKYINCAEALPLGTPPPPSEVYAICSTVNQTGLFCHSSFDKQQMNPYVYGVLGNWRPWRSYAYYGDRRNNDLTTPTDITKNGMIDNFENFWIPATAGQQFMQKTNSTKWVWNSETTQYNRKGTEIENRDPMIPAKYNSGVYGYQETLPVVTANNARVREIAFDGFEDHTYKDQLCEPYCKPYKRHFDVGDVTNKLSTSQHHTGTSSLSVPLYSTYTIKSLVFANDTDPVPDVNISMTTGSCIKPDIIKPINHQFIDSFSLIPGRKYVLSAWVKEGANGCNCENYLSNTIDVISNNASIVENGIAQKANGNIIEGWQRYEFTFTVPIYTQEVKFVLKNNSAQSVFYDDIRIHPFNSSLKSFVYDPVNLRLSAELDENNYATFYEYDDEGTLVRVKKETKDGIKTIRETRSALQKNITNF